MKYYLINTPQGLQSEQLFIQRNPHLAEKLTPITSVTITDDMRPKLQKQSWITQDNQYDPFNLALTKKHLELWKEAITTQNDITIFQTNFIMHTNFLNHQKDLIQQHPDYDLFIWGYDLNWNLCLQLHPAFPRTFYTFPGHKPEEINIPNNQLIDIDTYQKHAIDPQAARIFSFAGLGCYSISFHGAKKLLEKCLPIGNTPSPSHQDKLYGSNFYVLHPLEARPNTSLEIEINRHLEDLNAYVSVPPLGVIQ